MKSIRATNIPIKIVPLIFEVLIMESMPMFRPTWVKTYRLYWLT